MRTAIKCASLLFSLILFGCAATSDAPPQASTAMIQLGIPLCERPAISAPATLPNPEGTVFYAPQAPAYPYPATQAERDALNRYATCISNGLSLYIDAWLDGRAPAQIPDALIPWGTHREDFTAFTLRHPDRMRPEEQWEVRPAGPIDQNAMWASFMDPNATYLVMPAMLAPFGTRLVIEGEFPHARYFSAQATPPFNLTTYHYDQGIGVGEVPIADSDIAPLPGHTNPFQVGANRNADRRSYRLVFNMAEGDPVAMNPAFRPPYFRQRGNERYASGILYQGPWGHPNSQGHRRGMFETGQLWLRYYAPDNGTGPLAGVPLPRLRFETAQGRSFFIQADLTGYQRRVQTRIRADQDAFAAPERDRFMTEEFGWVKQAGIFESIVGGIAIGTGGAERLYVNNLVRGVAGRGDHVPAPGNYEQSATSATHIDYLVRGMNLERDHVVVMSGRLPTFPDTRDGSRTLTRADVRYWSITGYHVPRGLDFLGAVMGAQPPGVTVHSVMDDEVVLDRDRNYVIVFSRDNEKPSNALASNGATWVDWGASAEISWTLRWLTVGPDWRAPYGPIPQHIGDRADIWSEDFDPEVAFRNTHTGALGPYLPVIHYMSREEFEAFGANLSPLKP